MTQQPALQLLVQHAFPAEEGSTLFSVTPGDISLGIGAPDAVMLAEAAKIFAASATEAFQRPMAHSLLQYGPTIGDGGFLTQLAAFLTRQYDLPVNREHLVVTSGASFGLTMLCHLFTRPGRFVFMPDPCYFISRDIFRDAGLTIVPIPSDDHGIQVDFLERELAARLTPSEAVVVNPALDHKDQFSALMYLVPTHCNPTSTTLPLERRKKIIEVANKYGVLVVCDDVYDLLTFPGCPRPPTRLVALDASDRGCVVSNGSFSKIFGPGTRLGWFESRPWILNTISKSGIYCSGGSPNHLTSGIFRTIMQTQRLDQLLLLSRQTYADRAQVFCEHLKKHLPVTVATFTMPQGGPFVWVEMAPHIQAERVLEISRNKYHVIFQPGNWSSVNKTFPNCMRLCFTYNDSATLATAADKLAQAILEVAASTAPQ